MTNFNTEEALVRFSNRLRKMGIDDALIDAIIYVNRDSQKGIVIGEGGSMLKKIGMTARKNLESFFEKNVRLNLLVKVKANWVSKPEYLDIQGL